MFRWSGVVYHDEWVFSEGLPVVKVLGEPCPNVVEYGSLDAFIDDFAEHVRGVYEEEQRRRDVRRERLRSGDAALKSLTGAVTS